MREENYIPRGWTVKTLGDICNNVSRRFDFNSKSKVIFINTGDVLNGRFLHKSFSDKKGLPGQAKKAIKKGDILYSEIRPKNKRFAIVDFEAGDYVVSTKLMVIEHNDLVRLDFLFTLLSSNKQIQIFNEIAESRSGTFPQITFDSISYLKILLPPLPEQKAIASILTSFDDKIELLQAQNETLETIAQTIFKEWFGKYQVGDKLPEGWRVGKIGEVAILKSGYAFKSNDFIDESNYKALKIKDLKGNGKVDISNISCIDKEITVLKRVKYFKLSEGDLVLAMSGNTTGKIGVVPPHEKEIYLNQRVGKFFLDDKRMISYLYNFLMSNDYENKILSMGYGSAQPNINPSQIENIDIIYPVKDQLKEYLDISNPIFSKVLRNYSQIQTLQATRDTLLPKLMSGQLRVAEFQEQLSEVM